MTCTCSTRPGGGAEGVSSARVNGPEEAKWIAHRTGMTRRSLFGRSRMRSPPSPRFVCAQGAPVGHLDCHCWIVADCTITRPVQDATCDAIRYDRFFSPYETPQEVTHGHVREKRPRRLGRDRQGREGGGKGSHRRVQPAGHLPRARREARREDEPRGA